MTTPNLSYTRKDRIYRLEKRLERITNILKGEYKKPGYMLSDLSQFSKLERELEIQRAYLAHETKDQ